MCTYPEIESELNRKRIIEEMEAIRLEKEALQGRTLFNEDLALPGNIMVSVEERLRSRYHSSQETSSVKLVNMTA
jgi:hypothetical protein